jgi:hypothetical protein
MLLLGAILAMSALVLWLLDNSIYDADVDLSRPTRACILSAAVLVGLHAVLSAT